MRTECRWIESRSVCLTESKQNVPKKFIFPIKLKAEGVQLYHKDPPLQVPSKIFP